MHEYESSMVWSEGRRGEADVPRAERLVQKAEAACLVSKSLKTPVSVKADVRVKA